MVQKTTSPMAFTEVNDGNVQGLIAPILDTIRQAQYIALDTEFSGHCPTITKHMDQRYRALSQVIRTHTLFSFGLTAIFDQSPRHTETCHEPQSASYQFSNMEFLTRNQSTFQVDPNNIKFLAENGLDFGRIFQQGIPFCSGSLDRDNNGDKGNNNKSNDDSNVLRHLWQDILQIIRDKNIPIIIHNGLLDIMYIYQSFFATLPENLSNFVADLVEMFPAGIYDTKYLATTVSGESKSFLAYLYCKYRRLHQQDASSNALWNTLVLPALLPSSPSSPSITTIDKKSSRAIDQSNDSPSMKRRKRAHKFVSKKESKTGICGHYSQHGWCKRGKDCNLSHDLEIILDNDLGLQQQIHDENINKDELDGQQMDLQQSNRTNDNLSLVKATKGEGIDDDLTSTPRRDHSAHFDAYMTAFVFCHFLSTLRPDELSTHINKLNLMRMEIPLRLAKSHYAKPSAEWTRIKSQIWPSL